MRAPWDGGRLLAWAREVYPDEPDVQLALADLFWSYGIEHGDVRDTAVALVESGADLKAKKRLGMSTAPEPFLLDPGDCLSYPTSRGRVRNPYVSPAREQKFYA